MQRWAAVLVLVLVGCGDDSAQPTDAAVDSAIDAVADAAVDAPVDGPPEIGRRVSGTAIGVRGPSFVVLDTGTSRQLVPITEDGPFVFHHLVPDQTTITLSVMPFAPQTGTCQVTPSGTTINGADFTTVAVGCDGINELVAMSYSPQLAISPVFQRDRLSYATTRPYFVEPTDPVQVSPTAAYPSASITLQTDFGPVAATSGLASSIQYGTGWRIRLTHLLRNREYIVTSTPVLAQEAYLKSPTPVATDEFSRVAISNDTLVIGAPRPNGVGSVHVFVVTRNIIGNVTVPMWTHQATLVPTVGAPVGSDDGFGVSVAIDGDTIVVGSPREDSSSAAIPDEGLLEAGAAYVFTRTGVTWSEQKYLKASNLGADDRFGGAVAVSGDTIAVGAQLEDGAAADAGAVYVFTRSAGTWTEQAIVRASNADAGDLFGGAVGVSGDTLAVGAISEDSNGTGASNNAALFAGAAYVFTRTGTVWTERAYIKASNVGAGDRFGGALSLDGDLLAVGAAEEDSSSTTSNESALNAGAVYVFRRNGTAWPQDQYLKGSRIAAGDNFGASVAIDRNHLVVGANREDGGGTGVLPQPAALQDGSGCVFLYRRDPTAPTNTTAWISMSLPYIKASNTRVFDEFGASVALDGLTFAVGAPGEDGTATPPPDVRAGAVFVFR